MAEKTLNTRILLKYDTYTNWTTKNPVLKAGEVAIATIASGDTQEVNSVTAPQVLIKVGDGTSAYTALPFASAKAADVYSWAKADKKPAYSATEITGIGDYIAQYVDETLGISVDTDTQYRITKVDDYNYKLQSKAKGEADTAFADVSTIVIPKYDDTEVKGDISALETLVGTTAVATQIANAITALDLANTYEAKGTAATEAGKVQTALNEYKTSNDAVIAAIKDGTGIDSFKDVEDALAGKQAAGDYETKTDAASKLAEAKGYTDTKISELLDGASDETLNSISELATAIKENDSAIDALNEIAGTKASASDLTALTTRVSTAESEIDALQTDSHTHGNKTVLDGITAEKVSAWDAAEQNAKDYTDTLDESLASIAKTGNVNDLVQTSGDVLIFDCGDSNF